MRIYSNLLVAAQGLSARQTFPNPAAGPLVIRDVDVYWGGGLAAGISVRLIGSAGQTIWEVHVNSSTPPYDSQTWQWRGRQVIPPGADWAIECTGGAVDMTVSGYVFDN